MRTIYALALVFALSLAGVAHGQAIEAVGCKCGGGALVHRFGQDWDALGRPRLDPPVSEGLLTFLGRVADLPDRIERAVWWGTATGGAIGALVIGLVWLQLRRQERY